MGATHICDNRNCDWKVARSYVTQTHPKVTGAVPGKPVYPLGRSYLFFTSAA